MTDLVALIEQRSAVRLAFASRNMRHGPEYCGPCPFCGVGKDRFRVWPQAEYPHYWCRVCEARGNAYTFLARYCQLNGSEIADILGYEPTRRAPQSALRQQEQRQLPPPKDWRGYGQIVVEKAQWVLWNTSQGRPMLEYLRKRGLQDRVIQEKQLGYIPRRPDGVWHTDPR